MRARFEALESASRDALVAQGFAHDDMHFERILHLRYERTDCLLMCSPTEGTRGECARDFLDAFAAQYRTEFGFTIPERAVIADDIRVRGVARRYLVQAEQPQPRATDPTAPRKLVTKCTFTVNCVGLR